MGAPQARRTEAVRHRRCRGGTGVGFDDVPGPGPQRPGLPTKDTGEARQAAGERREAFVCPPARRIRLWQADFSEDEAAAGDTWNLGGVVD